MHGVKFTDKEPLSIFIRSTDTLSDLKRNILQKAGLAGAKSVKKVFYKIPMAAVSSGVQYETFVIGSDEDMWVLFHCWQSFPEVRIHELFAKLKNRVESSGASVPNPQSTTMEGASTSMPVVAPPTCTSTYSSTGRYVTREDETPVPSPAPQGSSSSGSYQQPLHFSTLNLEAVSQQPDDRHTFDNRGLHEGNASGEFQIGQSFQTKEEAVMSVKDYSIRRGVQYKVMESNHLKYVQRCKEFGNGCSWIIRVALRQRKGNWDVRRADAAITIKVLQEATELTYGFRPSYKKVWKAKQKTVA
ncbi:uncharacterized protein LOC107628087 [Arachis ipaensis]|uniref:uncharacterized protein LOC107628087 n=1 Tax=Arachis ipaensis TaxID=130454 RepID=UPI0007AF52D9|nr:uncharacterized protein LOC107628087 [Arachis ipaensis]